MGKVRSLGVGQCSIQFKTMPIPSESTLGARSFSSLYINQAISHSMILKIAFHTIGHDILLQKLRHYRVSNSELNFFRSDLNNRK